MKNVPSFFSLNSRRWRFLPAITLVFALAITSVAIAMTSKPTMAATTVSLPFKSGTPTQGFAEYLGWYYGVNYNGFHPGEDWHIPDGKVYACAKGKIEDVVKLSGNLGQMIIVNHSDGLWYSEYTHVIATIGLKKGDPVDTTTQIAVLATGLSVPTHLHWAISTRYKASSNWYEGANGYGYYPSQQALADRGFVKPSGFIISYTVNYHANGGTGAPASQTKQVDSGITLSTQKPSRDGYAFQGWKDEKGITYSAGASYTANADVTLYAVWTPAWTDATATFAGKQITIQSKAWGNRYLSARQEIYGSPIYAYATSVGSWEKFTVSSKTSDGYVGFQAVNGRYLSVNANNAKEHTVTASGASRGNWECFKIMRRANDFAILVRAEEKNGYSYKDSYLKVSDFKTNDYPKFAYPLRAERNTKTVGAWECFTIMDITSAPGVPKAGEGGSGSPSTTLPPPIATPTIRQVRVLPLEGLACRTGPSASYSNVGGIGQGAILNISEIQNGFGRIGQIVNKGYGDWGTIVGTWVNLAYAETIGGTPTTTQPPPPPAPSQPANGVYKITNAASGRVLNVNSWSAPVSGNAVTIYDYVVGDSCQRWSLQANSDGTVFLTAGSVYLNVSSWSAPQLNDVLTVYTYYANDPCQRFRLIPYNGKYLIVASNNSNLVLTATGTGNQAAIRLQTRTNATNQLWDFTRL